MTIVNCELICRSEQIEVVHFLFLVHKLRCNNTSCWRMPFTRYKLLVKECLARSKIILVRYCKWKSHNNIRRPEITLSISLQIIDFYNCNTDGAAFVDLRSNDHRGFWQSTYSQTVLSNLEPLVCDFRSFILGSHYEPHAEGLKKQAKYFTEMIAANCNIIEATIVCYRSTIPTTIHHNLCNRAY